MTGAGESVAGLIRPGATYPWLYRKRVPFHVAGTSMRYWAAPMLPVSDVVVGDGRKLGVGAAPVDDEHAASSSAKTTTSARLTEVKPRPRGRNSDVGPRLPAVDGDARTVDQARLPRADERHHARHLFHGAEAAQRHLETHELGDLIGVRTLAPVPSATFPQDRTRRDAVDGHALGGDLPRERRDEADLGCLGGVIGGSAAGLAAVDR